MPLNVRRFYTSVLLVLVSLVAISQAQTIAPSSSPTPPAPTSGDIMRERISKAKAFIAVRNYNAAIYELENIRKETADPAVQSVVSVLLMNSYLEQGDYARAQKLLNEFYTAQKTTKANAAANYLAVAGQVVKGARSRAERYRSLGLSVNDRSLPTEAVNDLEKMRETLELVITQSKEIGGDKAKAADGMALLEEASNSRGMLARDDYDSRRWKDEVADTREEMVKSRSIVLSAVSGEPAEVPKADLITANPNPVPPAGTVPATASQPPVGNPSTSVRDREAKPAETSTASNDRPVYVPMPVATPARQEPRKEDPRKEIVVSSAATQNDPAAKTTATGSIDVGSLLAYATKQAPPIYPNAARSARQTGLVKVEVTVDENGEVAKVEKTTGPIMLQNAAKDAILKWKFKPFVRDGQPVRASGFVNFNFSL